MEKDRESKDLNFVQQLGVIAGIALCLIAFIAFAFLERKYHSFASDTEIIQIIKKVDVIYAFLKTMLCGALGVIMICLFRRGKSQN